MTCFSLSSSPLSKHLLEICDLLDVERKMDLYKAMFYCNVESQRDNNFIKADCLRIELIAGGLNWKQQEFIMDRLQPNSFFEVSFTISINTYSIKKHNLFGFLLNKLSVIIMPLDIGKSCIFHFRSSFDFIPYYFSVS